MPLGDFQSTGEPGSQSASHSGFEVPADQTLSPQADRSFRAAATKCAYIQTQKQFCGQIKMQTNATQMPMFEHAAGHRQ